VLKKVLLTSARMPPACKMSTAEMPAMKRLNPGERLHKTVLLGSHIRL